MAWTDEMKAAGVGAGIGTGSGLLSSALNWLGQEWQMKKQYEYGEKAADNALQRQKDYYDYTFDKQTPAAYRKLLEDAGLSVGLMYGMQGGGGVSADSSSGPQGGGAGSGTNLMGQNLSGFDAKTAAEIELLKSQTKKNEAEAGESIANMKTIDDLRESLKQKANYDALNTALDYAIKQIKAGDGNDVEYHINGHKVEVKGESLTVRQAIQEFNNTVTQGGLLAAQAKTEEERQNLMRVEAALTGEKEKYYAQTIQISLMEALAMQTNAETNKKFAEIAAGNLSVEERRVAAYEALTEKQREQLESIIKKVEGEADHLKLVDENGEINTEAVLDYCLKLADLALEYRGQDKAAETSKENNKENNKQSMGRMLMMMAIQYYLRK